MRAKDIVFGVLALLLASLPRFYIALNITLLLIPIASVILMRFLAGNIKYSLALLFLLSLSTSSLLIYRGSVHYEFFGVFAYMFLASLVLVAYVERFSKKDS